MQTNVIELLTQLLKYEQDAAERSFDKAGQTYKNTRLLILIVGGITALLVLIIAIQVTRRTVNQTRKIRELSKLPIENPSPVIRIKYDGTILFVNEASNCLLEDWACEVGDKVPDRWCEIIQSMGPGNDKMELIIPCKNKIYALTLATFIKEGYVNLYGKDITEGEKLKNEILYQATHDSLTGLANPMKLEMVIQQLPYNKEVS